MKEVVSKNHNAGLIVQKLLSNNVSVSETSRDGLLEIADTKSEL
jgi:hypothetical protein